MVEGPITRESLAALAASFHDRHRQTYGHANPNESVQLVNLRLTALGRSPELTLRQHGGAGRKVRERSAWFPETGFTACLLRRRRHRGTFCCRRASLRLARDEPFHG